MRRLLISVALIALATAAARATVVVPADLAELARDARFIVRGQVIDVEGQWTDDHRTIESVVTLRVESALKGEPGGISTFRVSGGTLGRYRNIVVGAPQFEIGQRVVVFLGATGPVIPYLVGFHQGVYRIGRTLDGSTVVVPPPPVPSATPDTGRGAPSRLPMRLEDFEQRVRALAGGAR